MTECPILPWMRRSNLLQRDVAEILGTQQSAISAFIRRERGLRPRLLLKLSEKSGVSVKVLVEWMASKPAQAAAVAGGRR